MWVSRTEYRELVAQAATSKAEAIWLLNRVNQLEAEVGDLKFALTGKPQRVPEIHKKQATPPMDSTDISFEDVGDDLARQFGIGWENDGRLAVPGV